MTPLEEYYNKFNEEKRLLTRHGQIEYIISMKYIHDFLPKDRSAETVRIADIGAGTGRYAVALAAEGFQVTAVEPVRCNLGILKKKKSTVTALQGNALNLKKLESNSFDLTLLFGPLYHLTREADKLQALSEAKRITKPGGIILTAYCMNDYSILTYGFKEKHILECQSQGMIDSSFHTRPSEESLYDYVRTEDIRRLSDLAGLTRIKLISPDGPANYMRPFLHQLSEEEFEQFVSYQLAVCEREDLIGAGAHTVDILQKPLNAAD